MRARVIEPAHGKAFESHRGEQRLQAYERGEEEELTPHQLRIVTLASQGLEDRAIAAELGITYHTVRTHWRRIRERTGESNRGKLIADLVREGKIP